MWEACGLGARTVCGHSGLKCFSHPHVKHMFYSEAWCTAHTHVRTFTDKLVMPIAFLWDLTAYKGVLYRGKVSLMKSLIHTHVVSLSPHLTPPLIWLNLLANLSTSAQCSHRFTVIPTGFPNRCVVIRRTLTVGLLQPVGSALHHLTSSAPLQSLPEAGLRLRLLESYWMQIFGSQPMSVKENAVVFRVTVWSEGRRRQLDAWVWKWQKQKKDRDRQIGRQTWCN